ncbi:DUF937 domain-containing protein [Glaciihabitans arcticus]|uniref:DUF937 domain-containing protein n=1 Tax=Glaciihabitans arcticus TaxID=2668039 RepID=A0A4Q9GN66_9MICO|nr:DUF937 domain-containing protein [Glaciihabitans arcticus]TBN56146.1 DUF937 domain-containing protein [Glaciihabitans arcticus]
MSDLDGLLATIPVGDIAKKLGVDEATAESAVKQILPALVGGMAANSTDEAGAKSLEKALGKHSGRSVSVADVDEADGEKIVNNVFGAKKREVVTAVAAKSEKADESLISKLLPILAPIVLAWLASQFFNKKEEAAAPATPAAKKESGGGGIGDLLGGLVGSKQGQDMLGGLLGGLLGGGKK